MQHYYSRIPVCSSNERMVYGKINETDFKFVTDNGVFSKKRLDFATEFLLKTLLKKEEIKGKVLDLGCGYGPIGIVISKLCDADVLMSDINLRAIELAERNAFINHVTRIDTKDSDCFGSITEKFDIIITNPPIHTGKTTLYNMYKAAKEHLNEKGTFYLIINKKHGAPTTIEFLKEVYGSCEVLDKKAGFNVLKCQL